MRKISWTSLFLGAVVFLLLANLFTTDQQKRTNYSYLRNLLPNKSTEYELWSYLCNSTENKPMLYYVSRGYKVFRVLGKEINRHQVSGKDYFGETSVESLNNGYTRNEYCTEQKITHNQYDDTVPVPMYIIGGELRIPSYSSFEKGIPQPRNRTSLY